MLDEIKHYKVGFASLLRAENYPSDPWFDWIANDISSHHAIFTMVRNDVGVTHWEVTSSSFFHVRATHYLGFKAGAIYGAEIGQRTLLGRVVSAERYLDFHGAIKLVDLSSIPYEIRAVVTVPSAYKNRVLQQNEHHWDHSLASITHIGSDIRVDFILRDLLNFAFLQSLSSSVSLLLEPLGSQANKEKQSKTIVFEALDLFA